MPATCPYPQPAQSSPYPTSHFLKIHLNIILTSMPGSLKQSLSFRFPHQNPVYAPLPVSLMNVSLNNLHKALLGIHSIYLGSKDIHCIFKTCSPQSFLFSKKFHLFLNFILFCSNHTYDIHHVIKFEHQT